MGSSFNKVDPNQFSRHWLDVAYANEDPNQILDLWLPNEGKGPFPLIIFLHGGGWIGGDKREITMPGVFKFPSQGYAVACVEYRFAPSVTWPAPLEDVRAAIRFLRANAEQYCLKADKIAIMGNSAGGHLACMVAALAGRNIFRGNHLGNADQPDNVQCLIGVYPATDLHQCDLSAVEKTDKAAYEMVGINLSDKEISEGMENPIDLLMGFSCLDNPTAAMMGSPIAFVTSDFPPAYFLHGMKDRMSPYTQSVSMVRAINHMCDEERAKYELFPDAGHGDPTMKTDEVMNRILDFIDDSLWEGNHERTALPKEIITIN